MTPFVLVALAVLTPGQVAPAPGAGRWSGTVADPDGRPVANAAVVAVGDGPVPSATWVDRATTDGDGRFRFETARRGPATLWAFRPGSRLAWRAVHPGDEAAPIAVRVGPAGDAAVTVLGPDGRPLAGAQVTPTLVAGGAGGRTVPTALEDVLTATTGPDGVAPLPGLFVEDLMAVRVRAPGLGTQVRRLPGMALESAEARTVRLRPVGRVTLKLNSEDPAALPGRSVRITTTDGDAEGPVVGEVEATTDADGRVESAEVPVGRVAIRVRARAGSPELPAWVSRRPLDRDRPVAVEIPLRRGIRVQGTVRDAAGTPIPGAAIALRPAAPFEPDPVTTGPDGHFEAYVPPGPLSYRILHVPAPWLGPPSFVATRPVEVPIGIDQFEVPPITLTRGADARGEVVDADGKPVAGAQVVARWTYFDGRTRVPRSALATSDPAGRFAVGPVDPGAELDVAAAGPRGASAAPVRTRADAPAPVRLTLVAAPARPLTGRVVDPEGHPVAGAKVRLWYVAGLDGEVARVEAVTDALGQYHTDRLPVNSRSYHAIAGAAGFQPGRTHRVVPSPKPGGAGADDPEPLPDLVLARVVGHADVVGRVIDRAGQPVADAAVWAWGASAREVRARTDDDGSFHLVDAAAGPGFLFVDHGDFRLHGRTVAVGSAAASAVAVVLDRDADPVPPAPVPAGPPAATHPDLARSILQPLVATAVAPGAARIDAAGRIRTLETLATIDPAEALGLIDRGAIREPWLVEPVRAAAARALAATEPDRAAELLASLADPEARADGLREVVAATPDAADERRRGWLERAQHDAAMIRDPARRASALARVAGAWLDLGDPAHASSVFGDARALVDHLPGVARGARARGELAEHLARVDPVAALALLDAVIDPIAFDQHRLGVARVLAGRDPAGAGRIVGTTRDVRSLAADLPALCHAVARFDPDLARGWLNRLGPGSDPCLAPFAQGLMALAVARPDPANARRWLADAFDRLDAVSAAGDPDRAWAHDPAETAVALLAVVAEVDRARVPEFTWRALAIRGPRARANPGADAALIAALVAVDRRAAETLSRPLAARVRSDEGEADPGPVLVAAATLEPDHARHLLGELPDGPDDPVRPPQTEARLALAASLADLASGPADPLARLLRFWEAGGGSE